MEGGAGQGGRSHVTPGATPGLRDASPDSGLLSTTPPTLLRSYHAVGKHVILTRRKGGGPQESERFAPKRPYDETVEPLAQAGCIEVQNQSDANSTHAKIDVQPCRAERHNGALTGPPMPRAPRSPVPCVPPRSPPARLPWPSVALRSSSVINKTKRHRTDYGIAPPATGVCLPRRRAPPTAPTGFSRAAPGILTPH